MIIKAVLFVNIQALPPDLESKSDNHIIIIISFDARVLFPPTSSMTGVSASSSSPSTPAPAKLSATTGDASTWVLSHFCT
jgi:hypothetical protein